MPLYPLYTLPIFAEGKTAFSVDVGKQMSERGGRDLIFELLEKEWNRRVEVISKTRKIEPDDIVALCTLTLNREMGELVKDTRELKETVTTKEDLNAMRWMITIGFALLAIVVALLRVFV